MYKQSIIFFGLLLPILLTAAILGGIFYAKSEVETSFATKKQHFSGYEMTRRASLEIEKQVIAKRPHLERWQSELSKESIGEINRQIREISVNLPPKEFQLTATERADTKAGLAAATEQKSSQVRLAFRGTFRTVQKAFLELESRMPQLQLQDLKIDPSQTQSSLLNFQVSYTAWEN